MPPPWNGLNPTAASRGRMAIVSAARCSRAAAAARRWNCSVTSPAATRTFAHCSCGAGWTARHSEAVWRRPLLISDERFLAELDTLRDFGYRAGALRDAVFQFDIRVDRPLLLLEQLQHFLDRRLSLAPREIAAGCIAILQVQADDLVVILFDHRDR